jgi:hypothetical protein
VTDFLALRTTDFLVLRTTDFLADLRLTDFLADLRDFVGTDDLRDFFTDLRERVDGFLTDLRAIFIILYYK